MRSMTKHSMQIRTVNLMTAVENCKGPVESPLRSRNKGRKTLRLLDPKPYLVIVIDWQSPMRYPNSSSSLAGRDMSGHRDEESTGRPDFLGPVWSDQVVRCFKRMSYGYVYKYNYLHYSKKCYTVYIYNINLYVHTTHPKKTFTNKDSVTF